MKSDFLLAFNQVCSDRGLSRDVVLEALQAALVSAYSRSLGIEVGSNVMAKIDLDSGDAHIFVEKQVVIDEATDPMMEIPLEDAREIRPNAVVGETVTVDDTPDDFGRIAAQNAKQIILQRIREAEREARYAQYVQQEGEIVHGTVQSIKPQAVTLHLEGTEALLPRSQQVPGERYSLHQRLRAYVLEVRKTGRGPQIVVSRSHKNMLRRLLELEVPEIFNGAVEIKAISREAGSRSKVAVAARQAGVDPVGACVGMRGVRIQSIVNELGGEKIDVIEWNADPDAFIAKALSPAKVLSVYLEESPGEGQTANVTVPDNQLSLAIGRAGQNARLAAKLTGWRIDIQGVTEAATWAMQKVNQDPEVLPALGPVAELLPSVANILQQHEQESLSYTGEDLLVLRQVIDGVSDYYTSLRDAERAQRMKEEAARRAAIEAAEAERREAIEAALSLIPAEARDIPITEIGLSTRVLGHLEKAGLETAWDIMERLTQGDEGLLMVDGIGPKSLAEAKACIEALHLPEVEKEPAAPVEEEAVAPEPGAPEERPAEAEEVPAEDAEPAITAEEPVEAVVEEAPAAVAEEAPEAEVAVEEEEEEEAEPIIEEPEPIPEEEFVEDEELRRIEEEEKADSSGRNLKRKLVYDEELGEVIAIRRHKGEEDYDDLGKWEEYL